MNETIRVQLGFPLEQVTKPIIWQLAHDFGLQFSVRKANIDIKAGGFALLDLTGSREKLEEALAWALEEGVEVSTIGVTGADEWLSP